jgi:hypothetical protein
MDWTQTTNTNYQQPICPPRPTHNTRVATHEIGDPTVDDGKPTSRPLAGHPLLREGKVLLYPPRFVCDMCKLFLYNVHCLNFHRSFLGFNKGFQPKRTNNSSTVSAFTPGDPSRPCLGCWRKFGKEYTEELAKLDWKSAEANLQKPISRSNAR